MDIYCHVNEGTQKHLEGMGILQDSHWFHFHDTIESLASDVKSRKHEAIFIFEWDSKAKAMQSTLADLHAMTSEYSFYVFLLGEEKDLDQISKALEWGAHDVLTHPVNEKLFEQKVRIASQIVNDRQALLESSAVLERYATHVDKIAAERAHQLFHAERLSTLGTMSAGIAHEIKTPLGYMATSLETAKIYWEKTGPLLKEGEKKEQGDKELIERVINRIPKALDRIDSGLYKINRIMKSLQTFAHSSKGEKKEVDVNECIEMALEICEGATQGTATVETTLCPELPSLSLDPIQLEQVVTNLIVNASHALEHTESPQIRIATDFCEENITIVIEDNGPGIPEDKWETIWQPFYTTKEAGKGTGLGLAICKGLMKDNGGTIALQNGELGGACFVLTFPRKKKSYASDAIEQR